jgi:Phage integrase, N-terminal SAM-like domain
MADLCERYLREFAREHKKPSSIRMDERNIANHVLPLMGDLFVEEVTRRDIDQFKLAAKEGRHADPEASKRSGYGGGAVVTGGPGVANAAWRFCQRCSISRNDGEFGQTVRTPLVM